MNSATHRLMLVSIEVIRPISAARIELSGQSAGCMCLSLSLAAPCEEGPASCCFSGTGAGEGSGPTGLGKISRRMICSDRSSALLTFMAAI
jgi:hypothetical protein